MNKATVKTILLVSAVCLLADAVSGWFLADLGSLASVVLSILFLVYAGRYYGAEAINSRNSALANTIVTGLGFLSQNALGGLITVFSFGVLSWIPGIFHTFESALNIVFGIWQLVAWSQLKDAAQAQAAPVNVTPPPVA